MSNEKKGNCPLCKSLNITIKDSHILPKFTYRIIKNDGEIQNKFKPIRLNDQKKKLIITDNQYRKDLLCGECEKLFQKHEDKFKRFFDKLIKLTKEKKEALIYSQSDCCAPLKENNHHNLDNELLNENLLHSFKYLTLSIFIRQYYVNPSNYKINKSIITKIEDFLLSKALLAVNTIIYINTNNNLFRACTEVFYTNSNQHHHFSILLSDVTILIMLDENNQNTDTTICIPADFIKDQNMLIMAAIKNHLTAITNVIDNTEHSQTVNDFFESIQYKKSTL